MSTYRSILCAAAAAALLTACASGPPPGTRVLDIEDMDALSSTDPDWYVVRIPEGTRLPVHVELATPFAHSEGGSPALHAVFDRTVYWYPPMPDRISFDGKTWEALTDGRSGSLSLGIGKGSERGAFANVSVGLTADE